MIEAIRNLGILKMIQEFPDDFTKEFKEIRILAPGEFVSL